MCGLITLLLVGIGFFGIFGISSSVVMPADSDASIQVVTVESPLRQTPTPTPEPQRTASRVVALTMTPSPAATVDSPEILTICSPSPQSDLELAAAFDGNTFQSPSWLLSATSSESMTRFSWNSSTLGGVAMYELLHYDCGYTDDDVDAYFSEDVWGTLFASYETWEETAYCVVGRLRLHEFAVTFSGYNYTIRYWIDPVNEQRVASFMLVLPEWETDSMDTYAEQLYPDLTSCASL